MPEFADIFSRRAEARIEANGETLNIAYDPSKWPVRWHVRVAGETISFAEIVSWLAGSLLEWDLTLDGAPIPISEETLWEFPKDAIELLYNRIFFAEMGMEIPDPEPEGKEEPAKKKDRGRSATQSSRQHTTTE